MSDFTEYIISPEGIIKDAIQLINNNKSRCVIVADSNLKVFGVISEGDILRQILSGMNIYTPIKKVININFKFLKKKDKYKALNIFKNYGITLIPIVNEDFILEDVITIKDFLIDLD